MRSSTSQRTSSARVLSFRRRRSRSLPWWTGRRFRAAGSIWRRTPSSRASSGASPCPSFAAEGCTARRSPSGPSSRAKAATAGSTPTRCPRAARSSSGSASSPSRRRRRSSFLPQLAELFPARVDAFLDVLVRLGVEILAADRTEACAVGAAEDLLGQREGDCVPRPSREIQAIVLQILRPLLLALGLRRLVFAEAERERKLGVGEAAEARPLERDVECELEHRAARRAGHRELGGCGIRPRLVGLAAEDERLQLDLDALARLIARAEPERAEVEGGHPATVARGRSLLRGPCGEDPRGAAPAESDAPAPPCVGGTARPSPAAAAPPRAHATAERGRACRPRRG